MAMFRDDDILLGKKDGSFKWLKGNEIEGAELFSTTKDGGFTLAKIENGRRVSERDLTAEEWKAVEALPEIQRLKPPTLKEIKLKAEAIATNNEASITDLAKLISHLASKVDEVANQDPGVARRAKIQGKRVEI